MDNHPSSNVNHWEQYYSNFSEACQYPGNRYPHEAVIHFLAGLNKKVDSQKWISTMVQRNNKSPSAVVESRDKKALDIGFGTIADLKMLADFGYEGFGVEVSDHCIQMAKNALKGKNLPVHISKYAPYKLEFEDNFFDVIISNAAAYYNVEFETFLQETKRVLKKNGHFFHRTIAPDHGYVKAQYIKRIDDCIWEWTEKFPIPGMAGRRFVLYDEKKLKKVFSMFSDVKISYIKYNYQPLFQSWNIITGSY